MEKKVLVLKGSARVNGNSELLADALIEGAIQAGNVIKEFNLSKANIGGCRACNRCWDTRGNCILQDDMKKLEMYLENADVLVIATPLYWLSFPAQVKAFMDRTYEYDPVNGGKHLQIKKSILLACGETDKEADFVMLKETFKMFSEFNGMTVADMVCVTKVTEKGDIKGNIALQHAKELGRRL